MSGRWEIDPRIFGARERDTTAHADEVVGRAAEWLDETWPIRELGPWYDLIDLERLDLAEPCLCVCGQLGTVIALHEGYGVKDDGMIVNRDGLEISSGYTLFSTEPNGQWMDDLDRELAQLLRKRLMADPHAEESIIPSGLDGAFVPLFGGNAAWETEIRKRRELDSETA